MLTVDDARGMLNDYTSSEDDEPTIVDLLVDRIKFAETIILNKVSSPTTDDLRVARRVIKSLNPDALLSETENAKVALESVLRTRRFDFEKARQQPMWFKELNGFEDHVPESEEYGIRSFVFRVRAPFLPEKFNTFLSEKWPGVERVKGTYWIATRLVKFWEISLDVSSLQMEMAGLSKRRKSEMSQ